MMRQRQDLYFIIITKRVERILEALPEDWGEGYEHVTFVCTVENQAMAERRLPLFLELPLRHRAINCEPLLESLSLAPYLGKSIERVSVGGESGAKARPCYYEWVLDLREQCVRARVPFSFRQTGANFFRAGRHYAVPRSLQHSQARKAGIDYQP